MTGFWLCVAVALVLWRGEILLRLYWTRQDALLKGDTPEKVEMPQDLLHLAQRESAPWAREQTLEAMQEKYRLTGDWNQVRTAYELVEVA